MHLFEAIHWRCRRSPMKDILRPPVSASTVEYMRHHKMLEDPVCYQDVILALLSIVWDVPAEYLGPEVTCGSESES